MRQNDTREAAPLRDWLTALMRGPVEKNPAYFDQLRESVASSAPICGDRC